MLYFASKGIDVNSPQVSVQFIHLGSLFSITFRNDTDTDIENLSDMRIGESDYDPEYRWAYNTDNGGQAYDLASGEFLNKEDGSGWYISFNPQGIIFPAGQPVTLWSWYPPLPDINWPNLQLGILPENGSWIPSQNSKPARTAPTTAGKSYHFYAKWNGTQLNFTNDQFQTSISFDVDLPELD